MNDKKDINLDETNFRVFANEAIKKYNDSGRILDCLLWRRIINLFEAENKELQTEISHKDIIIRDLRREIETQRKEIEYLERSKEIC
jgi:hypothetical protein